MRVSALIFVEPPIGVSHRLRNLLAKAYLLSLEKLLQASPLNGLTALPVRELIISQTSPLDQFKDMLDDSMYEHKPGGFVAWSMRG